MTRHPERGRQLAAGDQIAPRTLTSLSGPVDVPDPAALVHLQFRRFAGCPICNLHLRSVTERIDEITAAGIREIVVFHSTPEELQRYEADLPLTVVPDPTEALYAAFGVGRSARAIVDPRVLRVMPRVLGNAARTLRRDRVAPPLLPTGGDLGLPADLLIASDGRAVATKYGAHAFDQWSVDELLAHRTSYYS